MYSELNKIIKIDDDNIDAIDEAKKIFEEKELTAEFLDARDLTFEEDTKIKVKAERIAEMFCDNFNDKNLREM